MPIRIRGGDFLVDPYHIGFWREVGRDRWEPRLLAAMERLLHEESVFADIGSWIGPIALHASRRCRKVYCFEPDPVAYRYLLWNLDLNRLSNVVPLQIALGAKTGVRRISSPSGSLGDSKASLLSSGGGAGEREVLGMRWSDWLKLAGVGRIHFIKMDIEGGEFELVPDMADYLRHERPLLHLSLHAPLLPDETRDERVRSVIEALEGYEACYGEDGLRIDLGGIRAAALEGYRSFWFGSNEGM